ncbi:PREDICTED: heavy metal-associated isoprenylated plant protein 3 [Tarenaya hassleriana]|uniref:heavy metal-associated isoprenylated plant protein 3 n=1 Tax=Tarenaya hassleriana TaxID=28532 RepID=UPI00053C2BE4|nr:PREDICTED: heavy metal-associated isoprenylated plant protein 3 [Tarenaya hassleriana]
MAKENKKDNVNYVDVEFKVPMHCNECERKIAGIISKFKGVEKFMTDMNSHKVVVTGKIDPKKLGKKLKKKTGKRIEIVAMEDKDEEHEKDDGNNMILEINLESFGPLDHSLFGYDYRDREKFMVFSDENPKSLCCIS